MQFFNHLTYVEGFQQRGEMPGARQMGPEQMIRYVGKHAGKGSLPPEMLKGCVAGMAVEHVWRLIGRPYFNVYPIILELSQKVKLDIKLSDLKLGWSPLMLRFPQPDGFCGFTSAIVVIQPQQTLAMNPTEGGGLELGLEPFWMTTGFPGTGRHDNPHLVEVPTSKFDPSLHLFEALQVSSGVYFHAASTIHEISMVYGGTSALPDDPDATLEDRLNACREVYDNPDVERFLRLIAILAIIDAGGGEELVSPIIAPKPHDIRPEDIERWIKKKGWLKKPAGFDVGKELQAEVDAGSVSPHYRRPHPWLAPVGKGRKHRVLRLRRGSFVNRKTATQVPTGLLDDPDWTPPESE